MTERPILFSGPMVREILAGRKTQTRRPVKVSGMDGGPGWPGAPTPHQGEAGGRTCWCDGIGPAIFCPYGAPGDRLWVRETHQFLRMDDGNTICAYRASCEDDSLTYVSPGRSAIEAVKVARWRPSIHMPRWASRITLEVTSVRVERLQDITEEDARAEGMASFLLQEQVPTCRDVFRYRWDEMYGDGDFGWKSNPWVWVVTFRRVEAP